jgi:predicted dehydrogenase
MVSIGIVGSDNSHALAYSTLVNVEKIAGDNARVVAIWGQEPERTAEVAQAASIEHIVAAPEDMLGSVDVVFVEDRDGGLHADHAIPFLERGIPVFVDKPLALTLEDCGRIISVANENNAWVTSFSSLRTADTTNVLKQQADSIGHIRSAQFAGPCDFESIYGGPYFYATHTVEIALRLVGEDVRTVSAVRSGPMAAANVTWADGTLGSFSFLGDAQYHFHATLFGTQGMVSGEVLANHDGYRVAAKRILDAIDRQERPHSDEELVRPVAIVHAIEESLANDGATIEIEPLIEQALKG